MNSKKEKIPYKGYLYKAVAMILLLISVTFAWFIFAKEVNIGEIGSNVVKAGTVSITGANKENWGNKLEIEKTGEGIFTTEFSGNGENLYIPIIQKKEITGYYLPSDNDEALNSMGYIEITAYVQSNMPISFYLSPESSITPYDPKNTKDYIAGAVRVAILTDENDPFIWAPNTTYQLNGDGTVTVMGEPESEYKYVYSSENEQFLGTEQFFKIENPDKLASGVSPDKRFVWGDLSKIEDYTNSVAPIFNTGEVVNGEIEIKIVVRIWVEGTDREAVQSMIGGRFNINLKFLATEYRGENNE